MRITDPEVSRREQDAGRVASALAAFLPAGAASAEPPHPSVPQPLPPPSELPLASRSVVDIVVPPVSSPPPAAPRRPSPEPVPPVGAPVRKEEPPTRGTAPAVLPGTRGPMDFPVTATVKTVFPDRAKHVEDLARHAEATRGTQMAPKNLEELIRADAAKQRRAATPAAKAGKPLALPPAFWRTVLRCAALVLLAVALAGAGWGGWNHRAGIGVALDKLAAAAGAVSRSACVAVMDRVNAVRFNKKLEETYWTRLGALRTDLVEITSADKYVEVTNRIENARLAMDEEVAAVFGHFLRPPRKGNEKAIADYRELKDEYDKLCEAAKKDLVPLADRAKKKVIEAYLACERANGDREYTYGWTPWRAYLEKGKVDADENEIAEARTTCDIKDMEVVFEKAIRAYGVDALEEGNKWRAAWDENAGKLDLATRKKDAKDLDAARKACEDRRAKAMAEEAEARLAREKAAQREAEAARLAEQRRIREAEKIKAEEEAARLAREKAAQELEDRTLDARNALGSADAKALEAKRGALNGTIEKAKALGLGTAAALDVVGRLAQRIALLTKKVPVDVAGPLDPAVTVKWSLDNLKWEAWSPGVTVSPAENVWVRFERNDYVPLAYAEPLKALPGEGCRIGLPKPETWRPTASLEKLNRLRGLVGRMQWKEAAAYTNETRVAFDDPKNRDAWPLLVADVVKHFKEEALQARIANARKEKVARLAAALTTLTENVKNRRTGDLADFAWPPAEKDVADDPAVAQAGAELAGALSNWLAVACADLPLATRAARSSEARKALAAPGVQKLLGDAVAGALQKRVAEVERRRKVNERVGQLQACRGELEKGSVNVPADLAWPPAEKDVADDPAVAQAGAELAGALSNWLAVACADQPLATRAARLAEAEKVLGTSAVTRLLGRGASGVLLKRTAAARGVFVLLLENTSGLETTVQLGSRTETLSSGERRELRLLSRPATAVARLSGYADQPLPVAWAEGGGQSVSIGRFTALPVSVEIVGDAPGTEPSARVALAGAGGNTVADRPGTFVLPPGDYTVTFSRPDYESQRQHLALRAGDRSVRVSAATWQKGASLLALERAEALFAEKPDALARVAGALPAAAPLADPGHAQRKARLEARLVAGYEPLVVRYLGDVRKWQTEVARMQFQIADPETGALRKERGETAPKRPERPTLPPWVETALPEGLRTKWQGADQGDEKILELCRDAHTIRYQDTRGSDEYFPWEVNTALAAAVDLGYVPNRYDVALAEYAVRTCQRVMDVLTSKNIVVDTGKLDVAKRGLDKIRAAAKGTAD